MILIGEPTYSSLYGRKKLDPQHRSDLYDNLTSQAIPCINSQHVLPVILHLTEMYFFRQGTTAAA